MFRFSHLEKKIILHEAKSEHLKTLLGFQGVIGLTVLSSPLPLPFLQSHTTPHCISFHPACCFADRHYHINKQRKIPKSVSGNSVSLRLVQHCLVVLYSTVWFFYLEGLFVRVPTSCLQSEKSYHVICFSSL